MVKPFYQGKLDTFCAIYAVLNALRLTHGIRVLKARDILNETLLALAGAPEAFRAVLDQETDYLNLVDGMLRAQSRAFPLEVRRPFAPEERPTVDEAEAILNIRKDSFVTRPEAVSQGRLLYIQPGSLRLLRLPF